MSMHSRFNSATTDWLLQQVQKNKSAYLSVILPFESLLVPRSHTQVQRQLLATNCTKECLTIVLHDGASLMSNPMGVRVSRRRSYGWGSLRSCSWLLHCKAQSQFTHWPYHLALNFALSHGGVGLSR